MDSAVTTKDQENHEMLIAYTPFITHLYSFITSMSIKCAVQLGITEAIHNHGKPMALSDLAAALLINPGKAKFLSQLMRTLSHLGYFSYEKIDDVAAQDGAYGYSLTTASKFLLEDHPFSVKPYVLFTLNPISLNPWIDMSDWFRNDEPTPFQSSNGMALWECTSYRPEINKHLNGAMAGESKMTADALLSNPRGAEIFEGLRSLVDVGGGLGEMARAIAKAYPNIKCVVLDLPHVVEGLEGTHNLSFIAGDMLKAIPPANAMLLKCLLHDWSDEDAVKILKQCKKAITSYESSKGQGRGKVIIIDCVMDEDEDDDGDEQDYKKREAQLFLDMQMMPLLHGKERTKKEWEKLFLEAGFNGGFKISPLLGFRAVIEVYP